MQGTASLSPKVVWDGGRILPPDEPVKIRTEHAGFYRFRVVYHLIVVRKKDGSYQRTEVGDRIAAQFREILVDEVQDINPLQDMLFQALLPWG